MAAVYRGAKRSSQVSWLLLFRSLQSLHRPTNIPTVHRYLKLLEECSRTFQRTHNVPIKKTTLFETLLTCVLKFSRRQKQIKVFRADSLVKEAIKSDVSEISSISIISRNVEFYKSLDAAVRPRNLDWEPVRSSTEIRHKTVKAKIAQSTQLLSYGLDDQRIMLRFPDEAS